MQAKNTRPSPDFQYWRARDRGPTWREHRILDRIAVEGLRLVYRNGRLTFHFDRSGEAVKFRFGDFNFRTFEKFLSLDWIVPDEGAPFIFPEVAPAQRYQAAPRRWR